MFFGVPLMVGGKGVVGWGRKFHLKPAKIAFFSSRDLSRRNKHDSFWLVVSTGYFYILFLWAIVVSDFFPLELYEHLVLPLSSIIFRANSQADNHFYEYIYLFQPLYNIESVFFIKIHVKVFCIQVWIKCEILLLFFLIKGRVYRKKTLYKKKVFFSRLCKN